MNQRKRNRQFWMGATHSVASFKKALFSSVERREKSAQILDLDAKAGAQLGENSCCNPAPVYAEVATATSVQSKQTQLQVQALEHRKSMGFQASIAEFLLVVRLRFQSKQPPPPPQQPVAQRCQNILERALQVVLITCKHWFLEKDKESVAYNRNSNNLGIGNSLNATSAKNRNQAPSD